MRMTDESHVPLPAPGASWDEGVFEEIFGRCYAEIYRYVYRIVGSQPAAEELAQETFLRLYLQRFPSQRDHNVRAWLYRVATHLAYNWTRESGRRRRRELRAYCDQADAHPEGDPQEWVERFAEQERVRSALSRVRPQQAQILLLRHAGLSYREIAEVLNITPGSVGTTLTRAMDAFRKAYEEVLLEEERRDTHAGT